MIGTKSDPTSQFGVGLGHGNLNDKLNPNCIDVPETDVTLKARYIRSMTAFVSKIFSPRQALVILRLLKAITFCTLCMTLAADMMYIFFVEIVVDKDVSIKLGGRRDMTIRMYGVAMSMIALTVELDLSFASRHFPYLKGFILRGFLIHFISVLTTIAPLSNDDADLLKGQIPTSSVVFQAVTSLILGICGLTYLGLGLLCFDRLTSEAFMSHTDPVRSTAIPPMNVVSVQQPPRDYQRNNDQEVI